MFDIIYILAADEARLSQGQYAIFIALRVNNQGKL